MSAKVDKKIVSDNLDVEVTHVDNGYAVVCTNKNTTAPLIVRVNFDNSVNLKFTAVPPAKMITATVTELTIPAGSSVTAANLTAGNPNEPYSYKYTCATQLKKVAAGAAPAAAPVPAPVEAPKPAPVAETPKAVVATPAPTTKAAAPAAKAAGAGVRAPIPEGTEETERKNLAEGLEILIHSINNGYNLQIDNADASSTFTVVLDLEASENLVITPEGTATLDGKKVTVSVPPKATVSVVNMPVDNWDLGSCELRYKAAIRKQ